MCSANFKQLKALLERRIVTPQQSLLAANERQKREVRQITVLTFIFTVFFVRNANHLLRVLGLLQRIIAFDSVVLEHMVAVPYS